MLLQPPLIDSKRVHHETWLIYLNPTDLKVADNSENESAKIESLSDSELRGFPSDPDDSMPLNRSERVKTQFS